RVDEAEHEADAVARVERVPYLEPEPPARPFDWGDEVRPAARSAGEHAGADLVPAALPLRLRRGPRRHEPGGEPVEVFGHPGEGREVRRPGPRRLAARHGGLEPSEPPPH